MARALALVLLCLLGACRQQAPSLEVMAADPQRLSIGRQRCAKNLEDEQFCARVEQADLQRFLSGRSGPAEYQSQAQLPPIPASFDDPVQVQP